MNGIIDPVQEKHYNVRNRVPDFLDIFQDWAVKSHEFRQTARANLDIRYGDSPKSTMDLFLPKDASSLVPIQLFIHGGYWQAMDKSDFSFLAKPFVEAGKGVIIVNYDLCPNVTLNQIVEQMRQCIIWIWENAENIGVDPDQIHVSGHSAGGHLVGELLATDWPAIIGHHIPNTVIKSCVAISGLYNLSPLVQTTINTNVGLTYETAKALSPVFKDTPVKCPVFCLYGGWEGSGFEMQSRKMHEHWLAQGLNSQVISLENATHFDAVESLADINSEPFSWAISQME
jgi:arylformamidase